MMLLACARRMCESHIRFGCARTDGQYGRTRTERSITFRVDHCVSQRTRQTKESDKCYRLFHNVIHKMRGIIVNPTQTGLLLNQIQAIWPNLKLNDRTRHAWALVLARLDYTDACEAVYQLGTERTSIQVAHIGQRAARIRRERLASVRELDLVIPPDIADNGALSAQWLRTARDRLSRVPA